MSQTQTQTTAQAKTAPAAAAPSTPTPALSARVLKKRETDRRCQRMIRERTKSRIAYLEGLVEQFRSQDSSGRVETLMRQLAEMKEERDVLAKKVKSIESIVSGSHAQDESETREIPLLEVDCPKPHVSRHENKSSAGSDKLTDVDEKTVTPVDTNPYKLYNKEFAEYQASLSTGRGSPSSQIEQCECCEQSSRPGKPNFNKWRYANCTLTAWFKWSPEMQDIKTPQEANDDIPIRAIVEGWDVIEQQNPHPAWLLLKGIDQNIFAHCDDRERLAIMIVMGLLIQAHLNPTRDQTARLPPFYLKRPSQDMLRSYAIEYFAWPGLRERFLVNEHRYCSNVFWKVLCNSFRILWPYEFRDCYVRNTETGLYQLSPTFHTTLNDIRSWAMGNEMFQTYPELYSDIPAWNSIPGHVQASPSRPQRQRALPAPRVGSQSLDRTKSRYHRQRQRPKDEVEENSQDYDLGKYQYSDQPLYSVPPPPVNYPYSPSSVDFVQSPPNYFSQNPAIPDTVTATHQSTEPFWVDWPSNFGVDSLQMDVV